ncbi:MAG: class I SAM-dependent methyltransferase [Ginsengibacter sp.]
MIEYQACPLCSNKHIFPVLSAKDYTVSQKQFEILECSSCTLRFTQKAPTLEEIGKYYQSENYISHSDTSTGIINYLYHQVRKRTLIQKRKLIEKTTEKKSGSILDVGCGTGAFLHTMQQAGWDITGLEPDENAAKKADELYWIKPLNSDQIYHLPKAQYDAITLWHVLEHVHDLHGYMKRLKDLLKPGGKLIIAVPNYTSYDAAMYQEFWAAYDVPRHLYHFSPKSMRELFTLHRLKIEKLLPMWFDSFYVSMLSEQYQTGKPNAFVGALTGGISNLKAISNQEKCSSIIYVGNKELN